MLCTFVLFGILFLRCVLFYIPARIFYIPNGIGKNDVQRTKQTRRCTKVHREDLVCSEQEKTRTVTHKYSAVTFQSLIKNAKGVFLNIFLLRCTHFLHPKVHIAVYLFLYPVQHFFCILFRIGLHQVIQFDFRFSSRRSYNHRRPV